MSPVAFHVWGRPIYWYGICAALAFLAVTTHWSRRAARAGRSPALVSALTWCALLGGIAGARIAYVIANWADFSARPMTIARIDQGGLIFYGGLIGGMLAIAALALARRESPWALGDFAVEGLPLGHALGRLGCFLNGCCGGVASAVCGVCAPTLHEPPRVPVQLYEAGANLLIYGALIRYASRRPPPGGVLAYYLLLYAPVRFGLEFLRGDPRLRWNALSVAQWISLVLFLSGAALWAWSRRTSPAAAPDAAV